jgi:carbamoyltransferase
MNILGLSCFYHDSAAAVLVDGRLVAAAQEERFTRIKHDPGFPAHAIDAVLATAGLRPADIDMVVFHEKPLLKFDRVLDTTMAVAPRGLKRWGRSLPSWFAEKLRVEDMAARHLGGARPFVYAQHHESHAASAFFLSPWEEAAVLTCDGVGEWATNTIGHGQGRRLQLLQELRFPHSLGLLYSAFTQYLGFKVNNGEYKVMGLAPYGTPRFADVIRAHLLHLHDDGSYRLQLEYFDFLHGDSTINERFADLFGVRPRAPEGPTEQVHMDLARSIQAVTEDVVMAQARHAVATTGCRRLVMAGGVALNSVANGKLVASGVVDDLWVQPAAGDAGGAVGAALVAWHHHLGRERTPLPDGARDGMAGAYLGPAFTAEDVTEALQAHGLHGEQLEPTALHERVAALIDDGAVVGWVQGRMEFGPRALGHRSILADPRRAANQPRVNAKIKFREGFRPFAPAVLAEHAAAWFSLDRPSPYMLLVVPVADAQRKPVAPEDAGKQGLDLLWVDRSTIPAVTHVDFSARVQTVHRDTSPRFAALLDAFHARTGCPVLLNTSFNLRGEPIVATPYHAARTFLASGMDALVLGDTLVLRPPDTPPTGAVPAPPVKARPPRTEEELRVFGVGGGALVALLMALQLAWGHTTVGALLGALALALAAPGAFAPERLRSTERVFAAVGRRIGHVNGLVLLGALHILVVTPLSALRRAVSGDPLLDRRPELVGGTWRPAVHDPDATTRYERMF